MLFSHWNSRGRSRTSARSITRSFYICQICTIVSNVPHLDFLNLSMNPLKGTALDPTTADIFCHIRKLVLINTHVTWDTVHTLTQRMPE